nr:hypothetical protein [uncultured Eisenbergiella sp.]
MSIKINNKEYEVPQLGFKDMVAMEDMGFSIIDLFQNQKVFSVATAFVGICAGCKREEAERLIEQHIMGGGSLDSIYESFTLAVDRSGFFKKLLGREQKE